MQMNDENIQTEEVKRAAEPEYKIPEDATDNSRVLIKSQVFF